MRLMDIYARYEEIGNEDTLRREIGRVLINENGYFEGIFDKDFSHKKNVVFGRVKDNKVELIKSDDKGNLERLNGYKNDYNYTISYVSKDNKPISLTVGLFDGEIIREVTKEEVEFVRESFIDSLLDLPKESIKAYKSFKNKNKVKSIQYKKYK